MGQKILSVLIGLILLGVFAYLIYLEYYAVTIISVMLLAVIYSLSTPNES